MNVRIAFSIGDISMCQDRERMLKGLHEAT